MGADAKRKEARKRKFGSIDAPKYEKELGDVPNDLQSQEEKPGVKKSKKGGSKDSAISDAVSTPKQEASEGDDDGGDDGVVSTPEQGRNPRFICFIGNLPFTATTESIAKHFAKVQPSSIRHRTSKESGQSKGFAFLEFSAYDRMKTCLSLYHHSTFDDGVSPSRKLNVELTAGGGGRKSTQRKTRLAVKNQKLSEERKRRALEERKEEKKGRVSKNPLAKVTPRMEVTESTDQSDIHPSRRARVDSRTANAS